MADSGVNIDEASMSARKAIINNAIRDGDRHNNAVYRRD